MADSYSGAEVLMTSVEFGFFPGSLWIPDWLGYFAQIRLLRKPEGRRI